MRPSALLPRIMLRRMFPMPKPRAFVPREVSPEEHAAMVAYAARGKWDRERGDRGGLWQDKIEGEMLAAVWRARAAQYDREQREILRARRDTFAPGSETWGAR